MCSPDATFVIWRAWFSTPCRSWVTWEEDNDTTENPRTLVTSGSRPSLVGGAVAGPDDDG
jgi:hypothetical protein